MALLEGRGAAAGSVAFLSRRNLHISHTLVEGLLAKATSDIAKPCATHVLRETALSSQALIIVIPCSDEICRVTWDQRFLWRYLISAHRSLHTRFPSPPASEHTQAPGRSFPTLQQPKTPHLTQSKREGLKPQLEHELQEHPGSDLPVPKHCCQSVMQTSSKSIPSA